MNGGEGESESESVYWKASRSAGDEPAKRRRATALSEVSFLTPFLRTHSNPRADAILDIHSRPPTRKLRNKIGTSPPPTPHSGPSGGVHPLSNTSFSASANANGSLSSNLPITTGPFLNPHSLSVDDLPSPFPLPLTSTQPASSNSSNSVANGLGASAGSAMPNGGRRRVKGGGSHQGQAIGGLGKSLMVFNAVKDNDLEADMIEIRRVVGKRRRAAANGPMAKTGASL